MPYSYQWHIPRRVLLYRIDGDITLDQLVAINSEASFIAATEGTVPVHTIVDVTDLGHYPPHLSDLQSVFAQGRSYSDEGWFIVVSQRPILRFLALMVIQVIYSRFRLFTSVADAETFLIAQDPTLTSAP